MSNKDSRLLSQTELLEIYGAPPLNDIERQKYFTFNEAEVKALNSFKTPVNVIYFALCATSNLKSNTEQYY